MYTGAHLVVNFIVGLVMVIESLYCSLVTVLSIRLPGQRRRNINMELEETEQSTGNCVRPPL